MSIRWILDADVSGCFDSIDRDFLREFVKRRVSDGEILRLIGKWLNAGVVEAGTLTRPDKGTPEGGVISPMHLAAALGQQSYAPDGMSPVWLAMSAELVATEEPDEWKPSRPDLWRGRRVTGALTRTE